MVVWDLSSSPNMDLAGARLLADLRAELAHRGVMLRVVDARASVRDLVRDAVGEEIGAVDRRLSIDDTIAAHRTAATVLAAAQ